MNRKHKSDHLQSYVYENNMINNAPALRLGLTVMKKSERLNSIKCILISSRWCFAQFFIYNMTYYGSHLSRASNLQGFTNCFLKEIGLPIF